MATVLVETKLWWECKLGQHDSVVELLESGEVDPKSDESFGTHGETPLHYACQYGWLDVVKLLIAKFNCDATIVDEKHETPLQCAHRHGHKDIVRYLVMYLATTNASSHPSRSSSISRNDVPIIATALTDLESTYSANQPLDESIRSDILLIVKFLFELSADLFQCIPRSKQEKLLFLLCRFGRLRNIRTMIEQYGCNLRIRDTYSRYTPLHYACSHGYFNIAQYLIKKGSDPSATDAHQQSSLHHACKSSNAMLVKCLVTSNGCDPAKTDSSGNTALHIACQSNSSEVVRYLLSETVNDIHTQNEQGQVPLDLTTSVEIIKEFIRHGANPTNVYKKHGKVLGTKHPLVPPVKVFLVGNPFAGKSTLAAALQSDASALFSVPFRSRKVTGVDERTAGVIPHDFKSKKYGRVTLYDLAGQREFYGSHSALLQNAIQASAPVFLLVVDLCDTCKEIESNILYWLAFIENQCTCVHGKPHVIVVGSHLDVLNHKGEDLSPKEKVIMEASHQSTSIEFAGFVPMDCQYSGSNAMAKLQKCLKASCDSVRVVDCISFNAHCFLVLLLDSFQKTAAVRVQDVRRVVTASEHGMGSNSKLSEYVPVNPVALNNICTELNDRGHILFLKDESDIENSWIIIDKVALLSKVNGTIFAPEDFKQHCQLATSTGVVPLDEIVKQFPTYDHSMLMGFLCHLEFCHMLSDSEILQLIGAEDQRRNCESYFLFPALIKLDAPRKAWEAKSHFRYHSGWILKSKHFYTPRFFQVLLLRLAFSCAFPQTESEIDDEFPALQRKCSIWKNGICWGTRDGVEALVEVVDQNSAILFLTRSRELVPSCLRLRSIVIQKILKAAKEFCPKIDTVEYFIAPEEVLEHPLKLQAKPVSATSEIDRSLSFSSSMSKQDIYTQSVSDLTLFSIAEVATALTLEKPVALSKNGAPLSLDTLLSFEPYMYMGRATLDKMFADSDAEYSTEIVPDDFLLNIADIDKRAVIAGLLKVNPTSRQPPPPANACAATSDTDILVAWRSQSEGTYKCLQERLDSFSVFAGRNIMVS